MFVLISTVR